MTPAELGQLAKDLKLTEAQRVFAEGLASGKTQRQAATDAGSIQPDVIGSRWFKAVKVQKYIKALTQGAIQKANRRTGRAVAELEETLEYLTAQMRSEKPAKVMRKDEDGNVLVFEPQKAALGMLGHYSPKKGPEGNRTLVLGNLPPDVLAEVYRSVLGQADALVVE